MGNIPSNILKEMYQHRVENFYVKHGSNRDTIFTKEQEIEYGFNASQRHGLCLLPREAKMFIEILQPIADLEVPPVLSKHNIKDSKTVIIHESPISDRYWTKDCLGCIIGEQIRVSGTWFSYSTTDTRWKVTPLGDAQNES